MTKQEAIEKNRVLLEVLRDLPDDDGIDVLETELQYTGEVCVDLYKGLEIVCDAFCEAAVEIYSSEHSQCLGISHGNATVRQWFPYQQDDAEE